jgi:type I restriction enzyme S subunit
MKYTAYDRYRDSGVPWLGDIPDGWEVKPMKRCLSIQNGRDYKEVEADAGYPVIGSGGQFTFATDYLYKGEAILLGRKGTIDKPLYINAAFWTVDTMYYAIPESDSDAKFLHYCSLGIPFSLYSTDTALPSMTQTALGNHPIAVPSHREQKTIAAFLDEKTAEIDGLIAKKEALLKALAEKRTAIITHAVTKGLNPTAKLKPSGVPWLGDIPEGWEVTKLRFLCKIQTGSKDTENNTEFGEYPFFVRSDTVERIDSYGYDGEAVLTAGDGAGVGKVFHYANGKFDFHQRVYAFTRFNKITGKFFYQVFSQFFKNQMFLYSAKSTVDSVRMPFLQEFMFPLPPAQEQVAIVLFLHEKTAEIDGTIQIVKDAIAKLKEYRTSLITNAVTGKIKVV